MIYSLPGDEPNLTGTEKRDDPFTSKGIITFLFVAGTFTLDIN